MKKINFNLGLLILLFATVFLTSCSGGSAENSENRSAENSENIEENTAAYDTEYSTLTYNSSQKKYYKDKDETELFTGTAGEKNSSDQLITLATIKNGFLVTKKVWTDFGGELILTEDMEYKDGQWFNGWYNYINDENSEDITITESYYVYKNGKEQKNEGWRLKENGPYYDLKSYLMIGEEGMMQASCVGKGAYHYPTGGGGDVTEIRAFLDCVKSQNLKNFHIYINE